MVLGPEHQVLPERDLEGVYRERRIAVARPNLPSQFVIQARELLWGESGHGMQHAPAVGKAISEVIADGESRTLDISAFSVARFAGGTGVPEGNVI